MSCILQIVIPVQFMAVRQCGERLTCPFDLGDKTVTSIVTAVAKPAWEWLCEASPDYRVPEDWDPNQLITVETLRRWITRAEVLLSVDGWYRFLGDPEVVIRFYGGYLSDELITCEEFHRRLALLL